jgi:F420-non-reducing hydrogenase small subunit
MPCRGCYGAAPNVIDQGAKMVSAIGSVIDFQDPAEIDSALDQIADPVGTFYRFSVPNSMLQHKQSSA